MAATTKRQRLFRPWIAICSKPQYCRSRSISRTLCLAIAEKVNGVLGK